MCGRLLFDEFHTIKSNYVSYENNFINRIRYRYPAANTSIESFHLGESPRPSVKSPELSPGRVAGSFTSNMRERSKNHPIFIGVYWCPVAALFCMFADSCDTCVFQLFMAHTKK